jgi:protoheme IX farnesyltransferase
MKAETCVLPVTRNWPADFVALAKPRIAVMVLFTVAIGALLAQRGGAPDVTQLLHTLIGVGLVACSANALNQYIERHTDALMRRTEARPLPSGRMSPAAVLVLGLALGALGLIYMALTVREPLATLVTALTLVTYVGIYTPLKRKTTLNTLIGAVPGALPPLIGWTSVTGRFDREGVALFLIVFLWQVPHFLAIAWLYRDDYGRAGLRMLPVADPDGRATARYMTTYTWVLTLVSLWPVLTGAAGPVYGLGALFLGLSFLAATVGFAYEKSRTQARRVLHASLLYLPAIFALMLAENWLGTAALAVQP